MISAYDAKNAFHYDVQNAILTVDDLGLVDAFIIQRWIDKNIDIILSNDNVIRCSYCKCVLDVQITIVYNGYVVGVYSLNDDELYIQSAGYNAVKGI